MTFPLVSPEVMEIVKEDKTPCSERLARFHKSQPNVSKAVAKVCGTGEDGLCVIGAMADLYRALELQMEMNLKELTIGN